MNARQLERTFGYTDTLLRNKPIREAGSPIYTFPTYTIPEAAIALGIAPRTLRDWFLGRDQILTASGKVGELPLLSFADAVEAYALYLLRTEHHFSMQQIKRAIANLPKYTRAKHPLISENLKVFRAHLLLERPARGERERQYVDLSTNAGQLAIPDVVDVFAKRVLRGPSGRTIVIRPWRRWASDQESAPVEIDPEVMSGRLVVTGTRIPVSIIAARAAANEPLESIAKSYRLPISSIEKSLVHVDQKAA
jgi:uncharacterized protein (DUF433 family)